MENIKMEVSSKYWQETGEWCVAVTLPEMDYWSENAWDKSRERAEKRVMEVVKRHIDWVREFKKSAEVREEVLTY